MLTSCQAQEKIQLIPLDLGGYGLELSLPGKWTYKDKSENMKNKLFQSLYKEVDNTTDYNTVSISLSYELLKESIEPSQLFLRVKKGIESTLTDTQIHIDDDIQVSSLPSKTYVYSYSLFNIPITTIGTYFIHESVLFCLQTTVFEDRYETYESTIKEITSSIKPKEIVLSLFTNSYDFKKIESRYVNNKYGFEIDFPIGWLYLEELMGNAVQVKKNNQETDEIFSFGISVFDEPSNTLSMEEYNQSIVDLLEKQNVVSKNDKRAKSTKVKNPNLNIYKTHFLNGMTETEQLVFVYTTVTNGKAVMCTATTDFKHKETNEVIFDDVIKTLKLK
jgi:hypothetical protein